MSSNDSITEAFEVLKEYMKENFNAKIVSGGKEILKRCHLCGDSRDPSDAHMYIGVRNQNIVYNCFKCNSGGIVDRRFLRDMGCYDMNIITLCHNQNVRSDDYKRSCYISGNLTRNMVIPVSSNEFAIKKLHYISERFGFAFNSFDAVKFKIILNLKDFLYTNHIERFTRHPDLVDLIDKFFIGFLSIDNRYVIMRRLIPEGKLPEYIDHRYLNYDIFGDKYDGGLKYYAIPNYVNVSMPMEIHIAEGAFDILSIYFHVAPLGSNAIFASVSGKSYASLVRYFIVNHGLVGFDLHLYPDSDISMNQMLMIKEDIKPFQIRVFIHRNLSQGEKDYGVSRDRIIDSVTRI